MDKIHQILNQLFNHIDQDIFKNCATFFIGVYASYFIFDQLHSFFFKNNPEKTVDQVDKSTNTDPIESAQPTPPEDSPHDETTILHQVIKMFENTGKLPNSDGDTKQKQLNQKIIKDIFSNFAKDNVKLGIPSQPTYVVEKSTNTDVTFPFNDRDSLMYQIINLFEHQGALPQSQNDPDQRIQNFLTIQRMLVEVPINRAFTSQLDNTPLNPVSSEITPVDPEDIP